MSLSPIDQNTALLIIDVQNAMDAPRWGERNNLSLVSNLRRVLDRWRALRWPVYLVADDSTNPNSPYYPGQPGNDFKAELAPIDGEHVVRKTTGSALIGTDLASRLRRAGQGTLVVGGFMTNKCVEATVRAAADLGFTIYVLADGTSTVGQSDYLGRWWAADEVHNLSLANMRGDRTEIIHIQELLTKLPG